MRQLLVCEKPELPARVGVHPGRRTAAQGVPHQSEPPESHRREQQAHIPAWKQRPGRPAAAVHARYILYRRAARARQSAENPGRHLAAGKAAAARHAHPGVRRDPAVLQENGRRRRQLLGVRLKTRAGPEKRAGP